MIQIPPPIPKEEFAANYASYAKSMFAAAEAHETALYGRWSIEASLCRAYGRYAVDPRYAPQVQAAIAALPAGTAIDWRTLIQTVLTVLEGIPVLAPFAAFAQMIFNLLFPPAA